MSVIDTAIARLQVLALACTGINRAPDYPIEDATALPLSIAHLVSGEGRADNASTVRLLSVVDVDFHFPRVNITDTYKKIYALVPEYECRLAGDPTLNGIVDTITFPVPFAVTLAQWDSIVTQMVSFTVQFKTLETPTST